MWRMFLKSRHIHGTIACVYRMYKYCKADGIKRLAVLGELAEEGFDWTGSACNVQSNFQESRGEVGSTGQVESHPQTHSNVLATASTRLYALVPSNCATKGYFGPLGFPVLASPSATWLIHSQALSETSARSLSLFARAPINYSSPQSSESSSTFEKFSRIEKSRKFDQKPPLHRL